MAVTPNSIVTPQTPRSAVATTTTGGGVDFSDTAVSTVLIATMGANGGRVVGLKSIARATIAAMAAGLYTSTDAGVTKKLIRGLTLSADTVSATDAPLTQDWGLSEDTPMILAANTQLFVQTGVTLAAGIDHLIEWADY
jgi:hypothetical protein